MNSIKTNDILMTINTLVNLSVDILKDIEYLETKKAEGELSDSEYQDLYHANEYYNAISKTVRYLETINRVQ
jgi:hypothetical protein